MTKMNTLACFSAMTLCAIVCAGCQADRSPAPGMADPYQAPINEPQITVISPQLRQWLGFQPAVVTDRYDDNRPMQVEVPMRNLAERQYLVEYRFLFYNEAGSELEPVMGWKMQPIGPKQNVRLKAGALHNEAVDWRLEVRWSE